jgi:hypothetical protein
MPGTKALIQTHAYYLNVIAFPVQQWLGESASVLRYTYIGCVAVKHFMRQNETNQL